MERLTTSNFGLLIAFVIPGYTVCWSQSRYTPSLIHFLGDASTIAGFLHITLVSVAIGVVISAVRWIVVDAAHACTGLPRPAWNDSLLGDRIDAFSSIIESHYRFYQFYGNMLVAIWMAYLNERVNYGFQHIAPGTLEVVLVVSSVILLVAARDTLRKYYDRATQLLS
jgi:hypothetical protein